MYVFDKDQDFHYLDKHVMSSRYEEDQEDRYNDVLIVMELLTNLLSKDFIDFGEDGKYIQTNSKYRSQLQGFIFWTQIVKKLF